MPPKKKNAGAAKKKDSKKGGGSGGGLELSPEEKVKHLQCQIDSLQAQLAARTEMASSATANREGMRQQMKETMERYDKEKETSQAVVRDMTRQYTAMKEQCLNKINDRENTIQNLRDELDRMNVSHALTIKGKDETVQEKDALIKALEGKMDTLCIDFSTMLSNLRAKMNADLENTPFDASCSSKLQQLYSSSLGLNEDDKGSPDKAES